jgi:SNF2 family DNA or RNA helicase
MFVCDEAHMLRNPDTERFTSAAFVRSRYPDSPAIAITGTPIQNSLRDAWALFEFALPGYCGERKTFADTFCDDPSSALALEPRISPFMLRRKISEVEADLPDLIEIPQALEMTDEEAVGYEALRQERANAPGGVLAATMALRMFCCHPRLRHAEWTDLDLTASSKFSRLVEIVLTIRAAGEKALIFTSFNEMNALIVAHFTSVQQMWARGITGETLAEDRQTIIDHFSAHSGPALLVLNPQVGGVGLNIQAANHVIHYNLEWNPAVESQATARAHRIGQPKRVRAHRLFYQRTIEEVMNARLELKSGLITHAVRGVSGDDGDDLAAALALSPMGGQADDSAHERS